MSSSASRNKLSSGSKSKSKTGATSPSPTGEIDLLLGAANDTAEANIKVKAWIEKECRNPQGSSWRPLWGTKFTEGTNNNTGIQNLGRVIGEEYIAPQKNDSNKINTLASYRTDWDMIKGKHFNPEIQRGNSRQRYAYRFGFIKDDLVIDPVRNKSEGEIEIIDHMLNLTHDALLKNNLMSVAEAHLILKNFEIKTKLNRQYFKEFSVLLRPLIEKAHAVILSSPEEKNAAYQFNADQLNAQVTLDLYEVWSNALEIYLESINHNKKVDSEEFDIAILNLFLSECDYAGTNKKHSDYVMEIISNFFFTKSQDDLRILFSYLKDINSQYYGEGVQKILDNLANITLANVNDTKASDDITLKNKPTDPKNMRLRVIDNNNNNNNNQIVDIKKPIPHRKI